MPSEPTHRRYKASNAPRPDIALDIERVVGSAELVADSLLPHVSCAVAVLVRRAGRAVEAAAPGSDVREVVCDTLVAHAASVLAHEADELVATLGIGEVPETSADLRRAARTLELPVDHDVLMSLSSGTDRRCAALVELWQLGTLRQWALGSLPRLLRSTWDEVDPEAGVLAGKGALDRVIELRVAQGVDAEALAWGLIIAETHNHHGLVLHECNKLASRYPDTDADDLIGAGWQGLRVALRAYDPRVAAFSTYACPRINGAIRDDLRAAQPIPKRLTTLVNKVARAEQVLTQSLGRAPELAELAEQVGATMEKMALLPRLRSTASIDEFTCRDDSDRHAVPSWMSDDEDDPVDRALAGLRRDAIEDALAQIDPDDAAAVRLHLLDGLAPGEAAAQLGTTTRRLRASKKRGLTALAPLLADWAPAPTPEPAPIAG